MELIGLIFELVFLGIGVYLYLFAIGKLKTEDQTLQEKANTFRKQNGRWLRILALAMIALMLIEITLHLNQLWSQS